MPNSIYCRFVLYYYSNFEFKDNQSKETKLTIETVEMKQTDFRNEADMDEGEDQALELAIKTK